MRMREIEKKRISKKLISRLNEHQIYSLTPDDDTNTFGFSLASMIACARYLPTQIKSWTPQELSKSNIKYEALSYKEHLSTYQDLGIKRTNIK